MSSGQGNVMYNFVLCQVNYEDISQLERFDSVYLDGNLTCKVYESFDNCINQVNCFIFILQGRAKKFLHV